LPVGCRSTSVRRQARAGGSTGPILFGRKRRGRLCPTYRPIAETVLPCGWDSLLNPHREHTIGGRTMSGLFGQLLSTILGGQQEGQSAAIGNVLQQVLTANGGGASLLSRFEAAGLGSQAQSWVSTGQKLPIRSARRFPPMRLRGGQHKPALPRISCARCWQRHSPMLWTMSRRPDRSQRRMLSRICHPWSAGSLAAANDNRLFHLDRMSFRIEPRGRGVKTAFDPTNAKDGLVGTGGSGL
jgi:hypothetical protein